MACSCLCSPLFHASDLNFQLIYNTSARIPSFGSAWADRKQRKQLSHTKPSLTVSLNYLCVFVFICPTKQVCISLASDTPQRASTGTAQRGSSGNTWLPEASPHSCIFFLCQFSADEMLKKRRSDISQKLFIWQSFSLDDSIDRYYHGRTAKNTALPQTTISAASTSSPRPQLHNSDRLTDETEAETPGPSAPLQSPGPAGLPSFMRGVRVFFYNLLASERKRLARYLITYPVRLGGVNPIIVLLNHSYHLLWDISGYAVPVKACIFKSFKRCCLNTINHPTIGTF